MYNKDSSESGGGNGKYKTKQTKSSLAFIALTCCPLDQKSEERMGVK